MSNRPAKLEPLIVEVNEPGVNARIEVDLDPDYFAARIGGIDSANPYYSARRVEVGRQLRLPVLRAVEKALRAACRAQPQAPSQLPPRAEMFPGQRAREARDRFAAEMK